MHLAVEQQRKTLATALTPGQAAGSPQFTTVLNRIPVPRRSGPGRPRTRPARVLADKAYDLVHGWRDRFLVTDGAG